MMSTRPDHPRTHLARAGFTLVEVLVVLSIAGLLLGLGLPSYLNYGSTQQVRTAARTLASDLQAARAEAAKRRVAVAVRFSSADSSCGNRGRTGSYAITQADTLNKRACLPAHVEWVSLPRGDLIFQSTGGTTAGTILRLRSTRTEATYTVGVASETGVITHDVP